MDKILKLLEIAKKFGVKPSKVIGTQGNVVPYKKPSLVDIRVDEFKLKDSVDKGGITMDKVQQEMEETVKLALSKNLNDVELNRALNNAVNLDRVFFPPSAEVVEAGSKQQVTGKGLEELIKKEGLTAPPTTPLGQIQLRGKRLEQEAKDLSKEFDLGALIKGAGKDQLSEIKLHNEGLVRAVTRQILSEDIKAGKIKGLTLEDLGTSREPIDYFRKIYGENALEQLDSLTPEFNRLNTEQEAAKLARTKFKFDPDETRTKGSMSYDELQKTIKGSGQPKEAEVLNITTEGNKRKSIDDLIDEYNANQDRLRLTDQEGGTEIGYQEFQDIQKRNEDIAKALEEKGISSTIEEEVKPEGIVIPFRKKFPNPEPEGKAQGGIIGYAQGGNVKRKKYGLGSMLSGLVFKGPNGETFGPLFTTLDRLKIEALQNPQTTTPQPEIPLTLNQRYNKYLSAAGSGTSDELYKSYRTNLDKKADGGRIGFAGGKSKTILDLIAKANKELKGKKSMESVNPKTGEVTVPKEPVKPAEGITVMDQEPIIRTTENIEKEIDELSTTPITTLEKKRKYNDLHSEFINSLDPRKQKKALDYRRNSLDIENKLLLKAEEQGLDFDTFEKLRQGLYGPRKQQTLNYIKTGKVNIDPVKPATTFEEVQNRYRTAAKASDEIFPNYNEPKTAASELANVMAEQKYGKVFDDISGDKQSELYSEAYNYITSVNRLPKVSPERVPTEVLQNKMNEVLNSYDKSMFIKNDQGMVDVANPENIAKMEELLRKDHPELHNQLKKLADDVGQKETLLDFDVTGRKPNSKGGTAGGLDYLMGF
jgi:hypothetical protein